MLELPMREAVAIVTVLAVLVSPGCLGRDLSPDAGIGCQRTAERFTFSVVTPGGDEHLCRIELGRTYEGDIVGVVVSSDPGMLTLEGCSAESACLPGQYVLRTEGVVWAPRPSPGRTVRLRWKVQTGVFGCWERLVVADAERTDADGGALPPPVWLLVSHEGSLSPHEALLRAEGVPLACRPLISDCPGGGSFALRFVPADPSLPAVTAYMGHAERLWVATAGGLQALEVRNLRSYATNCPDFYSTRAWVAMPVLAP